MRIDLHNHTSGSWDGTNSLRDYVGAYEKGKFDLLAITDHHIIRPALEYRERAPFPVIVGQEVRAREGDIIGLFLQQAIPPKLPAEEVIRRIRDQGGLVYVPHPFLRWLAKGLSAATLARIAGQVDILEVCNGAVPFDHTGEAALQAAQKFGLLRGAGSDAHVPPEIGLAAVNVPDHLATANPTPEWLLSALKHGTVEVCRPGPGTWLWHRLRHYLPHRLGSWLLPDHRQL